jgi:holo-[acyl-carrier protein] synthase
LIYGTGIDIVEIQRIAGVWQRNGQRFLDRVYTPYEQSRCLRGAPAVQLERLAAHFAAKEAVMKALGTGLRQGVSWRDIEIRHRPTGQPYISLTGPTKELAAARGIGTIHVSLSHGRMYAVASAIALKDTNPAGGGREVNAHETFDRR